MRIALLTSEYVTEEYWGGGLANYLFRLVVGMRQRGHEVEVFTESNRTETLSHDGVLVHRVAPNGPILDRLSQSRLGGAIRVLSVAWSLRSRLARRQRERPFDIVQASSCAASGLGLAHAWPGPVVTRLSTFAPLWREANRDLPTADHRLFEWLELYALRHSTAVYAPSRFLATVVHERTGMAVDVLEPPFALETTELDESVLRARLKERSYLLFFGQIGIKKGVAVLADTMSALFDRYPDLHLALAGWVDKGPDGRPMLDYVNRRAGAQAGRIHYLGKLSHSQLYPVVAGARAVALPSLVDNLPNTCLEAMALGRLVIGTRGTSFEELIEDGDSGILVSPGSSKELGEAITRVWGMSDLERGRMGRAAQLRVGSLAPPYACAKLEEYLQRLLPG